jgi:diguanylate cyclase (GGDEF)-like protein/putative nucleotidyltransferase with HDIG domain
MPLDAGASALISLPARLSPPEEPTAVAVSADGLPTRAGVFLVLLAAATFAATARLSANLLDGFDVGPHWTTFLVLAVAAAVAEAFVVEAPAGRTYHMSVVFVVAAALLLPPELLVPVGLLTCIPELLRGRHPWFVQSFDTCRTTLSAIAAWGSAELVLGLDGLVAGEGARTALAGLAACVAFVAVGHVVAAIMARLGRGHGFGEGEPFATGSIATGLVLAALGVVLAATWEANAWLIPLALVPLLFVHRSLRIPALQAEARVDAKTGLFNARHFAAQLEEELARATRFERPLSVIMADLDHLREVNNTYGHLAGDAVLAGIADVFREQLRHYDVPARFGGEEFSILLPETPTAQALEIAERIRRAVAARPFRVATSTEPVRVTVSIGVAVFPDDGRGATELIHQADLAVYRAKLQGRNRVLGASPDLTLVPAENGHCTPLASTVEAKPARDASPHSSVSAPGGRLAALVGAAGAGLRQASSDPAVPAEAEAIHTQNASLKRANRALKERSTAAMESLSATVDARDTYTAGHSRRVRGLALAIGAELDLSQAELDVLGRAALFHDIGKLAVPDAILLKPGSLEPEEWPLMRGHAAEGARIIDRLGFLADAVPAIRHHHERFDGAGYPDGLRGEEIPLGARIIHVADAVDSMLTPQSYRAALPTSDVLRELRRSAGAQFCPRCVAAVERLELV